jgi:hypothetical protein
LLTESQIENYPPGNTLVVTPEKMQKYYEETKVPGDTYPWNGKTLEPRSYAGLSADNPSVQIYSTTERPISRACTVNSRLPTISSKTASRRNRTFQASLLTGLSDG